MNFQEMGLLGNISTSIILFVQRMINDMFAEESTLLVDMSSGGFNYGLFLEQFDDLWDDMRQLDSAESKFLAICMLSCESFVHCCSMVKFISRVITKLCDWVPELALAMKSLKENVPKVVVDEDVDEDEDGDVDEYEEAKKAEAYHFAAYRRCWEIVYNKGSNFEDTSE
ncbi:hypothetical protein ZWY2020_012579 [Hordeum vulgare]|nr:hypothetical protein ZWY2020_012579 [Hordeum vulgare]